MALSRAQQAQQHTKQIKALTKLDTSNYGTRSSIVSRTGFRYAAPFKRNELQSTLKLEFHIPLGGVH